MVTIELLHLKFHAFHGVYENETILGGPFEVSLQVTYSPSADAIIDLSDTINYEVLFELVSKSMKLARPLLETVAIEILTESKRLFPLIKEASCSIYKINPPIQGFEGRLGVTIKKKYDE